MHAYIDESGHTGANLFDDAQPFFLTAAFMTKNDFDIDAMKSIADLAVRCNAKYLHASEIGPDSIEDIALDIKNLVELVDGKFYFAYIAKRDLAAVKFYDAIFDPGENAAASNAQYAFSALRFLQLMKFVALLDEKTVEEMWKAMMAPRSAMAIESVRQAIITVEARVRWLPDERSRQLMGDILGWAKRNTEEFTMWADEKQIRNGNLPNLVAFPAILSGIDKWSQRWGEDDIIITHDRQGEVSDTLREWHAMFSGAEPKKIFHFGDRPMEFARVTGSTFRMAESSSSPGLQIVDLALWLFRRVIQKRELGPKSSELIESIWNELDYFELSLASITRDLQISIEVLNAMPLSDTKAKKASEMVASAEEARIKRMKESES